MGNVKKKHGIIMVNVKKNMVLSWGKGILMVHVQKQSINQINCNVQNHGIIMGNVCKTWYYYGKCLWNMVLPW